MKIISKTKDNLFFLILFVVITIIIFFIGTILFLFIRDHIAIYHRLFFILGLVLLVILFFGILRTKRIFQEEKDALRLKNLYIEILSNFVGIRTYHDLFSRFIRLFIDKGIIFSATAFSYYEKDKKLVVKYSYAKSTKFHDNKQISFEKFIGRQAILTKKVYFLDITNYHKKYSFRSFNISLDNFYVYYFPIYYSDHVIGVLECLAIYKIPNDILALMEKVMVQIGIIMDHIKVQKEIKKLKDSLEEKNKILLAQNKELQAQSEELEAQTEELHAQKSELEETNKKLAQLERYKSEFLANMAHELRTPLNSIIGLSELILKEPISDESIKEKIKLIYTSGTQLLNIINDVLDLSKIESGKMEVNCEEFSLKEVFDYVKHIVKPQCDQKGLELIIENNLTNNNLVTDRHKLVQILLNLLSNAVKYTERGKIEVIAKEIDQNNIRIDIRDTGIGIKQELLDTIFEAFRRIESKKIIQGTGLGLPLTKKLLDILGGNIFVKSKPNKGTTFSIVLPRRYGSPMNISEDQVDVEKTNKIERIKSKLPDFTSNELNKKLTFLIVDDDFMTVKEISSLIKEIDPKSIILTASNGIEAIKALSNQKIDLIFLDLNMPKMDGYEFLEHLKENNITAKVVIITAMDIKPDLIETYGDYIKSIFIKGKDTKSYLKSIIQKITLQYKPEKIDSNKIDTESDKLYIADSLTGGRDQVETDKNERKKILLVEDNIANRYLIKEVLKKYNIIIDEASNGIEALDLLSKHCYDLILLDLHMPKMDGYETLTHIKENEKLKNIPVIAFTAMVFKKEIEKLKEMGFSDVILKPINIENFIAKIKKVMPDLDHLEKTNQTI